MKYFIDANVLLRFLLEDVPAQHILAGKFFKRARDGEIKIVVTAIIFAELVYALSQHYKQEKQKIVLNLGRILSIPYINFEERGVLQQALILYYQHNIDFSDLYIYCRSQEAGAEVLSFDKDFKRLGKKSVAR